MSDKMDDLFANVKKMVDSGNIPDDIKQMMNNLQNSSNSSNNTSNSTGSNENRSPDLNNILSQVSPEMLNNLSNMLNSNNQSGQNSSQDRNNNNSGNFNIDMNTIMKMQSIMSQMNNKNDPRANLLYSLKPYLRDSKKEKLDQYVNLLNISKIADMMNKNNNDNKTKQRGVKKCLDSQELGFPFQYYNPYRRNNFYNNYKPYSPVQEQSNNCNSANEHSISCVPVREESNKSKPNNRKAKSDETVWLDLFGIKLYFDDVLILSLLFFLYREEVKDEGLFLALVMLLIS